MLQSQTVTFRYFFFGGSHGPFEILEAIHPQVFTQEHGEMGRCWARCLCYQV